MNDDARESARRADGKFGEQHKAEAAVDLDDARLTQADHAGRNDAADLPAEPEILEAMRAIHRGDDAAFFAHLSEAETHLQPRHNARKQLAGARQAHVDGDLNLARGRCYQAMVDLIGTPMAYPAAMLPPPYGFPTECGSCGHQVTAHAAFCSMCGSPIESG